MSFTAEGTIEIDLAEFFTWVYENYVPSTYAKFKYVFLVRIRVIKLLRLILRWQLVVIQKIGWNNPMLSNNGRTSDQTMY